ncbi:hypothetical protein BDQ17DRAFT_1308178 [Cyathus striatus]|nr:hypothetical protein BDQ17DRAFT_1308178 [Cyathus striatus]
MSAATLDSSLPLNNTMGAMLIGVIFSAVLHGITLMQTYYYFTKFRTDAWYLKSMVVTVVCFDAIHLFFVSHSMYYYLVANYHNQDALLHPVWSIIMEALLTGVNAGLVQLFFTTRLWKLSHKNYFLTGLIVVLVCACASCGVAWVILSMQAHTFEKLLEISPLTNSINALSCAIDVIIASSLCFLLHRARTGFKRSDSVINRLMVFVVNTGMITTICAVSSLIALLSSPKTLIYATFYFCIGRLYTNSFLATLNARRTVDNGFDDHNMVSLPTTSGQSPNVTTNSKHFHQNISIRVDTTKDAKRDEINIDETELVGGRSETDLQRKMGSL